MKTTLMTLLAVLLIATPVLAGTVSPELQAMLDQKGAQETLGVIIHMTEQAPMAQINADLKAGKATRAHRHSVVVSALQEATRAQDDLLRDLDAGKADGDVVGFTSYWISNLIVMEATKDQIERIAARSDVSFVEVNFEFELIEPISRNSAPADKDTRSIGITNGLQAINADRVWYELGFTGQGRLVGSLDTGVDGNHPALANRWAGLTRPWQETWHDVVGSVSTFPVDNNSHGTHTTGTMAGVAADDTVGVAWGAQWIAANAIDQGAGGGFTNDIIDCLQWFADPDGNPETLNDVPDAVCNSWGVTSSMGYPSCYSGWYNAIDNCEASGVVTLWATGNEGPSGSTVRSPATRATSALNSFSVGSVNANGSYPYAISGFSSRGPSTCAAPEEFLIKPEVSAPGSGVYSSIPGGGYSYFDGTSMATPHVAGVVALMREAAPNIEVDTIKQILMDTAHDFGTAGEDNSYGWGFIDAYEAVLTAMEFSFGQYTGRVTNGSFGTDPLVGALVTLTDGVESFVKATDGDGYFQVFAPDGNYQVTVEAVGFATGMGTVQITTPLVENEDYALVDNSGPTILEVGQPLIVSDVDSHYPIFVRATDPSTVASAALHYRVGSGPWIDLAMSPVDGDFSADIPGQAANTSVNYYVTAVDGTGLESMDPQNAPQDVYTLSVGEEIYAYTMENPADNEWQMGQPGDAAYNGVWERADPVGTAWNGNVLQPEDDHTAAPGVMCFVTENGDPGESALGADIDGGCTTLLSPVFDMTGVETAIAKYWRWYGELGAVPDDEFMVDVSDDGGVTWVEVERVLDSEPAWTQVVVDLNQLISFTDQVVFRFIACDENVSSLVDAAIDDFAILAYTPQASAVPDGTPRPTVIRLAQNHPNPFNPSTTISFELPQDQRVQLDIYALDGRKVATLISEDLVAGGHQVIWSGMNDQGRREASGTYFYRLRAGDQTQTKRMILVK